jgi:hypothetical protein
MYGTTRTEAAAVKAASNQMVDQADSGSVNSHARMAITVYSYVRATTWEHQFAAQIAARPVNIGLGRQYPVNPFTLIEFRDSLGVVAWMPMGTDCVHFACTP